MLLEKHWQTKWDQWPLKAAQYLPAEQHHSHHHHISIHQQTQFLLLHISFIIPCLEFGSFFFSLSLTQLSSSSKNSNRQKPLVNFIFIFEENGNYFCYGPAHQKNIHLSLSVSSSLHIALLSTLPLLPSSCPVHISTFVTNSQQKHSYYFPDVIIMIIIFIPTPYNNNTFMLIPFTPSFHPFHFIRPSHKMLYSSLFISSFSFTRSPAKTNPKKQTVHHIIILIITYATHTHPQPPIYIFTYLHDH